MFVVAIICWVIAVVVIGIGLIIRNGWSIFGGALLGGLGFLFLIWSTYYTVDPGDAKVLKDWTGVIKSEAIVAPGAHWKAPWEETINWDIRNQQAAFLGDGTTTHQGQQVQGAEITFTDKDGVTANMDVIVMFSIDPTKIVELTNDYADQTDFRVKVIENDVKSYPRDVAAEYTTIQMFNQRAEVRDEIEDLLDESWQGTGVQIESVVLHGIRYPKAVQERFEAAQNAQTEVVKAKAEAEAELTRAEGEAAAKIARAEGEKAANDLLASSLTPAVLQQRYLDVLAKANLIVVPQGFTALGQIPTGAQ